MAAASNNAPIIGDWRVREVNPAPLQCVDVPSLSTPILLNKEHDRGDATDEEQAGNEGRSRTVRMSKQCKRIRSTRGLRYAGVGGMKVF